jgi:hypothetical protein
MSGHSGLEPDKSEGLALGQGYEVAARSYVETHALFRWRDPPAHVSNGSWLCENAVARKIDRTNRSSDRNFSDNNFSARSALSRSKKAILLVSGRVEFLHNHGQKVP